METLRVRDEYITVIGHVLHQYHQLFSNGFIRFGVGSLKTYVARAVLIELKFLEDDFWKLPLNVPMTRFMTLFLSLRKRYFVLCNIIRAQEKLGLINIHQVFSVPSKADLFKLNLCFLAPWFIRPDHDGYITVTLCSYACHADTPRMEAWGTSSRCTFYLDDDEVG